jgi:hypothetical protein
MGRNTFLTAIICSLIFIAMCMTGCGGHVGINSGGGGAINCAGCGSTGGGGGTGGSGSTTTGQLTLTLLDPPTCASPSGTFTHLYLSISGVQLNPDANATASSSGWVNVAESLATAPKQVDMFNLTNSFGNLLTTTAPTGSYGSLRLLLAPNTSTVGNNQCGVTAVNCAMAGAFLSFIDVASETTQGIVVNSSSISGATLPIDAGGSNVNILFDTCGSLISNSSYRLLPSVKAWAGGIATYKVLVSDSASQVPLGSGQSIVAMEKADVTGVDTIWAEATPDATGIATIFGPSGTFDFVATAQGVSGGTNTIYSPLAVTSVSGSSGSTTNVPMQLVSQGVAQTGGINLFIDATAQIDVRLSLQQSATINGVDTKRFTIPLASEMAATLPISVLLNSTSCHSAACVSKVIGVPSQPLFVQAFGTQGSTASSAPLTYTLSAEPFVYQGSGVPTCTTGATGVTTDNSGVPLGPLPGQQQLLNVAFFGCS